MLQARTTSSTGALGDDRFFSAATASHIFWSSSSLLSSSLLLNYGLSEFELLNLKYHMGSISLFRCLKICFSFLAPLSQGLCGLPGRWNPENGRSNGKFTWTKTGCNKILKCAGLELESQNNKWLVEKCRSKLEDPQKSLPLFCGSSLQISTSNAPQQANYPLDSMVLHRQTLIISGIHPARNVQKNPRSWPIPPNIASGVGISIVYRSLLRVVHHVFSKTIPAVRFFFIQPMPPSQQTLSPILPATTSLSGQSKPPPNISLFLIKTSHY